MVTRASASACRGWTGLPSAGSALETDGMIYFAYGSNMNPGQMSERCPGYRSIGVARLPGHRLHFPRFSRTWGCASASITPSEGSVVFGALYEVPAEDLLILHHQEGYNPNGRPDGNRHDFRAITVRRLSALGGSQPVTAMTYIAAPDGTNALPSAAYLDSIIDGARYHNLPRAYIAALRSVRTA